LRIAPWMALCIGGITTSAQAVEVCGEEVPSDSDAVYCSGVGQGPVSLAPLLELPNLAHLSISFAEFADPEVLGRLILTSLDLHVTPLESPMSAIAGMTSLEHLKLNKVGDHTFVEVATLTNLRVLTLGSSTAMTTAQPLSGLTKLTHLTLLEVTVTDLTPIAGAVSLERLYCASVPVHTVPGLSAMTVPESVTFGNAALPSLAFITSAPAVKHLSLGAISPVDLAPLGTVSTLESLDISMSAVTDISALYGVPNLNNPRMFMAEAIPQSQLEQVREGHPGIDIVGP
jgi:Leucine-rich repeat (LRR) protein